jgi:hypothetical protein
MILIAVEGSLFYLMNNIYPSQVNGIWETPGTIKANAYLLPFFMVITVVSPFLSIYVTKYRDVKWPIFIGFISFSASVIGLALSGTNGKLGLAFNGVGGLGFAPVLILIMVWVQVSIPCCDDSNRKLTTISTELYSSPLHRYRISSHHILSHTRWYCGSRYCKRNLRISHKHSDS